MARDVPQYEEIESSDLRTVRVAAGPEVDTIKAGDRDDIVGRKAAIPLREGSLLAPGQVVDEGKEVIGPDEAGVPVVLSAGLAGVLESGMDVSIVVSPPQNTEGDGDAYQGWVSSIGPGDEQTGERTVVVVVKRSASTVVADAARDDRVSILPLPGAEGD
jgi:hypothetical protein